MDLEQLIHEWIKEDRFLTKYTKRQRAILCKRLSDKLTPFKSQQKIIEEKETIIRVKEEKLTRYRNAYLKLLKERHTACLERLFCRFVWVWWVSFAILSCVNSILSTILPQGSRSTALTHKDMYKTPVRS
jgi:hypothetical protein